MCSKYVKIYIINKPKKKLTEYLIKHDDTDLIIQFVY